MKHLLPAITLVAALIACSEDSGGWDAGADTSADTGSDTTGDVIVDSSMDSLAPDTASETPSDTAADTATDTATDPGHDGGSGGDGCVARDTPGCSGCPCEACVCEIEPHCCTLFWDEPCVWDCEFICGFTC